MNTEEDHKRKNIEILEHDEQLSEDREVSFDKMMPSLRSNLEQTSFRARSTKYQNTNNNSPKRKNDDIEDIMQNELKNYKVHISASLLKGTHKQREMSGSLDSQFKKPELPNDR